MTQPRDPLELLAELRQALWAASPNVVQQVRPALSDLLRQIDRQHGARLAAGQYVEFRGHGVLLGAEIVSAHLKARKSGQEPTAGGSRFSRRRGPRLAMRAAR